MDTVTYPDARVVEELARWEVVRLEVRTDAAAAEALGVAGIPTAVAMSGEARELGRISNRVGPAEFCGWLRSRRESVR